MLTLVLAETELERVPHEIAGHPQVRAAARAANRNAPKMLLDGSLHHAAMRSLHDGDRRGRPDLVHQFLLTALESRANKAGHLGVGIHTRNDEWITVDATTRLVRNYNRFCGLIEKLFEEGRVPQEPVLLEIHRGRALTTVIESLAPDRVLWLDETAPPSPSSSIFRSGDGEQHIVAIVGGFPHGGFRTQPPPGVERIGFGPTPLAVWTVAAELTVRYEDLVSG